MSIFASTLQRSIAASVGVKILNPFISGFSINRLQSRSLFTSRILDRLFDFRRSFHISSYCIVLVGSFQIQFWRPHGDPGFSEILAISIEKIREHDKFWSPTFPLPDKISTLGSELHTQFLIRDVGLVSGH